MPRSSNHRQPIRERDLWITNRPLAPGQQIEHSAAAMAGVGEYAFVDEWVVNAPVSAVFATIADTTTYPRWWKPVYKSVDSNGVVGVGNISQHHLRGALPYSLKLRTEVTAFDPPNGFEFEATGDLRGRGI